MKKGDTIEAPGAPNETERGSYRDPSGFVFARDGVLLRQINASFGPRWDDLESSGLLAELQRQNLLVGSERADTALAFAPATAHAVIRPERIAFISYPYEWSFGQLKDAALLTLEAQRVASAAGFELRDASAYNVQFRGVRPVLIDTLSFQRAEPGSPWRAYRQFCEHFLAPLALMAHRDIRLGLLLRDFIDGVPVDLAANLLPGRTKLDIGMAAHIHAHGRAQRKSTSSRRGVGRGGRRQHMSPLQQAALLDNLQRTIEKLRWDPSGTAWASYGDTTSYGDEAARSKEKLVLGFLQAAGGEVVWDLGANLGRFSAIAASLGHNVIAWDGDPGATELHYRALKAAGSTAVLPLLADLANPSPGLGWANAERQSLLDRANADVVLALALVHHPSIGRNVRVAMIADMLAALAPHAIVEFIPESDPMVQQLLATRSDSLPYLSHEEFRGVLERRFAVIDDVGVGSSGRRLLRMQRH